MSGSIEKRAMETKICKVSEMTDQEKRVCRALSFKSDGDLMYWLKEYPDADVVMVKRDDRILGWGIRTPTGETGYYVRKSERRQGIGAKVFYTLNNRRAKTAVIKPHDPTSAAFFYSVGKMTKGDALDYGAPFTIKRKPRHKVLIDR